MTNLNLIVGIGINLTLHGRNAQSHHLKNILGLEKKLPRDAKWQSNYTKMRINGTEVYLLSSAQAKELKPNVRKPHHLMAICNYCSVRHAVPAGRLHQHIKLAHNTDPITGITFPLSR